jgi:hypothetical protein
MGVVTTQASSFVLSLLLSTLMKPALQVLQTAVPLAHAVFSAL